jgi:flagellar biosynthesis protein FliQ
MFVFVLVMVMLAQIQDMSLSAVPNSYAVLKSSALHCAYAVMHYHMLMQFLETPIAQLAFAFMS